VRHLVVVRGLNPEFWVAKSAPARGFDRVFSIIWVSLMSGVSGTGASQRGDVGAFRGVPQCGVDGPVVSRNLPGPPGWAVPGPLRRSEVRAGAMAEEGKPLKPGEIGLVIFGRRPF